MGTALEYVPVSLRGCMEKPEEVASLPTRRFETKLAELLRLCTRKTFILATVGTIFLGGGIALIYLHIYDPPKLTVQDTVFRTDYVKCTDNSPVERRCDVRVGRENYPNCICSISFTVGEHIPGKITLYYELPHFDQTHPEYASSKDAGQLAGRLSLVPSASCGNYTYLDTPEGKKPIAPCGKIADSMFTDRFVLFYNKNDVLVPMIETGLDGVTEMDKKLFRNPHGDLKEELKQFSRPKSWISDLTELDVVDPNNNGFQNERFIGWMKTDLTTKPALRVNHTDIFEHGLPAGSYRLRITYFRSDYVSGPRIAIIRSTHTVTHNILLSWGIILIITAVIIFVGIYVLPLYALYNRE